MDWAGIGISAFNFTVAAGLAWIGSRRLAKRRLSAFLFGSAILFFAAQTLARHTYSLPLYRLQAKHDVDLAVRDMPILQVLATEEPAIFASLRASLVRGVLRGETRRSLGNRMFKFVAPLMPKYLPYGSDGALRELLAVIVRRVDRAEAGGPASAYDLMFPTSRSSPVLMEPFDFAVDDDSEIAIAQVIHSAAHAPVRSYDEYCAAVELSRIRHRLRQRFGEEVFLSARAGVDDMKKANGARVARAFLHEVIGLPPQDSALVFRHILREGFASQAP